MGILLIGMVVFVPLVGTTLADSCPTYRTINAAAPNSFGRNMSVVGDFNQDGIDDYIIGAPHGTAVPINPDSLGHAYVYSGASTSGNACFTLQGNYYTPGLQIENGRFGYSVAGADVNGDGRPEFVVGEPNFRHEHVYWFAAGKVHVFSSTVQCAGSGGSSSSMWTFTTPEAEQKHYRIGMSVANAGDVNGDGRDDIIFGGPNYSVDSDAGHVWVYSYRFNPSTEQNEWVELYEKVGSWSGELFGSTVSGAGDVNHDGFDDFLVFLRGINYNGQVKVYSGVDGTELQSISGSYAAFLGQSLSPLGDVNGDLHDDFLAADSGGHVIIFSGADFSQLHLYESSGEVTFGRSISTAGDVNFDGVPDVMIGCPVRLAAYVFSGSSIDGFELLRTQSVTGSPYDDYGAAVAGSRKIRGDGYGITLVGNPYNNRAYVYACGETHANFGGAPRSGWTPLTVNFTDSSTLDATSWSWTFGDGGTSTSQNPSHVYNCLGNYTVSLTVTGRTGDDTETKTNYVPVSAYAPQAYFTATPTTGVEPLTVNFSDASWGQGINSWSWDFGDGGTSTLQNPSHQYLIAGYYSVTLTVTSCNGSDGYTRSNYIVVQKRSNFTASSRLGAAPLTVDFSDASYNSDGAITAWNWAFGDGGFSNAQNPSHQYQNPGSYTVSLTVTGTGVNDTETKNHFVAVQSDVNDRWLIEVENNSAGIAGDQVHVGVFATPPYNAVELGFFDLRFKYDNSALLFLGFDDNGVVGDCDWEYFTWRIRTSPVDHIEFIGQANTNNATVPSCYLYPTGKVRLFDIVFLLTSQSYQTGEWYPVEFFWLRSPIAEDTCAVNVFKDAWLTDRFRGNAVYDMWGSLIDPGNPANLSRVPPNCVNNDARWMDFKAGGVFINELDGSPLRGDVNFNGINFEIADYIKFCCYFQHWPNYEPCYGTPPPSPQNFHDAADIDCGCFDNNLVTVNDLTRLLYIIVNSSSVQCPCPQFAKAATTTDTLRVLNASGRRGTTNNRVPIYLRNGSDLAGLQSRIVYDPVAMTPSFDYASGDSQKVRFELVGRAATYGAAGSVVVHSYTPGELLITFIPDGELMARVPAGAGTIMNVFFNVPSNAPIGSYLYMPIDEGEKVSLLSTPQAQAVLPSTAPGYFTVQFAPSCPVLYSYDGSGFVMENPLLTACEASGYRDIVTDYYHVQGLASPEDGRLMFQLREMEDEVSYVSDLQLMTVDHSRDSKVATAVDGTVYIYKETAGPLSAIDNEGVDRLAEVSAADSKLFTATKPGYLIVTFPNAGTGTLGLELSSLPKRICFDPEEPLKPSTTGPEQFASGQVDVEILDANGQWASLSQVPPRQFVRQEVVVGDVSGVSDADIVTLRISWEGDYSTDVISLLIPTSEKPTVRSLPITQFEVKTSDANPSLWSGFGQDSPLTLRKGDQIDFLFQTTPMETQEMVRDYVVVAQGRYEPDYSIFKNLLPDRVTLFENYPNPFNPTTTISFSLPATMQVKLEVFNVLGQKVTTLVDDLLEAGQHRVDWNAENVASGVYFYTLTAEGISSTKKMMVLK
jgi:PKD repeat protein